jgi:membrane protease YdiL (CAAX protease family)
MKRNKQILLQLALATLIAMPMLAVIIDHFSETVDLQLMLLSGINPFMQILIGLFAGIVIGHLAFFISTRSFMRPVMKKYSQLFGAFELNHSEMIYVSVCAGVGEEILFRGALQPLFGIIITSLLFVAIHGYLNPKNWRISIYGIFMTIAIIGIGYMTLHVGLISAIFAHAMIDYYLILRMPRDANVDIISYPHLIENEDITHE